MAKTVKYILDLAELAPLTRQQKAELKALAATPDAAINHSDIAPLTDMFWKNAVQNPLYKPIKQSTTVRVDSDVLLWLKAQGKGYQTRMNAILREAMVHALKVKS
jgi:uncharacterized protein (DUF4415 family)